MYKTIIDKNIMQQVIELLGWHEIKYAQFIYDCGLAYLNGIAPDHPEIIVEISKTETFWNWWKFHWEKRDKEFIEVCDGWDESTDVKEDAYKGHNDPDTLSAGLYMNGQVLHQTYAAMLGTMMKEKTKIKTEVYA